MVGDVVVCWLQSLQGEAEGINDITVILLHTFPNFLNIYVYNYLKIFLMKL